MLAGPDAKPALIATAERGSRFLTVKAVADLAIARDRALELWMLPDGRPPRSLGLVPASGIDRVAPPRAGGGRAAEHPGAGGKPRARRRIDDGRPDGPVLYTGRVERTY